MQQAKPLAVEHANELRDKIEEILDNTQWEKHILRARYEDEEKAAAWNPCRAPLQSAVTAMCETEREIEQLREFRKLLKKTSGKLWQLLMM